MNTTITLRPGESFTTSDGVIVRAQAAGADADKGQQVSAGLLERARSLGVWVSPEVPTDLQLLLAASLHSLERKAVEDMLAPVLDSLPSIGTKLSTENLCDDSEIRKNLEAIGNMSDLASAVLRHFPNGHQGGKRPI